MDRNEWQCLWIVKYIGLNLASRLGQISANLGMRYASNKILNSIVNNPNNINKYKLWQIKIYGKYTSQ